MSKPMIVALISSLPMHLDPIHILRERFYSAIASVFAGTPAVGQDPLVATSKTPKFGDYQCNAAMSLGKLVGKPPREVAQMLVKAVDLSDIAQPLTDANIAGPGFINITLKAEALAGLLAKLDGPALGLEPPVGDARATVVVDLCGVNLAKQMHVGHLRSTVIGDTVARVFERLGFDVKRQNHVGDWGLPIAMVIAALIRKHGAADPTTYLTELDQLDKAYRAAQADCKVDDELLAAVTHGRSPKVIAEWEDEVARSSSAERLMGEAKRTLIGLQNHEPVPYAVWKQIYSVTMTECLRVCAELNANVTHEHSAGESSYAGELAGAVDDLLTRSIAEVSQGAVVVRCAGIEEPCIIRKSDGAFLYATTDVCAIRRRVQKLSASQVVYCVDARQSLHFKQVFEVAHTAGYTTNARGVAALEHAAFGTILGEDGRPFKTRSGENVKLTALLEEARERALAAALAKNPNLSETERGAVARAVAIAAIRYTDLSSERIRDYVFSFDRMLAFEGNTGPYLLYAVARIKSIFRKAAERGIDVAIESKAALRIVEPAERALALMLLRFPQAVRDVAEHAEPHRLCAYVYELAGAFSVFFDQCHVITAPDEATRAARLSLCRLTERVLADGLTTLGIPVVERM